MELYTLAYRIDVTDLLPQIRAPTLVLHRRGSRAIPFRLGLELAAQIPDARFVPLEGTAHNPWGGDAASVLSAIGDFLGEKLELEELAAPAARFAAPVTILFTDMEGSTTQTQRLGDALAQDLLRVHNSIVREALEAYGGSEIKHTGDGIMASFPSASGATECALAIQRALVQHSEQHAERPMRVRIGLNAGEPVAEEEDLFGTAVQLARRICDEAEPGQVLVSDVVRQLAAGKGLQFTDKGRFLLKGFRERIRLFEVSSS